MTCTNLAIAVAISMPATIDNVFAHGTQCMILWAWSGSKSMQVNQRQEE